MYEGDLSDDRSRLFWAAMRDDDLRSKLIDLGFIQARGEGNDASYSWVGLGPDLDS